MNKEKVIDKVRKLMELATSDNPHEAQLAMTKAQKLMIEYNIEMQEVSEEEPEKIVSLQEESYGRGLFRRRLGGLIARNFRCMSYMNCIKNTFKMVFYGKEIDSKIALMVYECALKIANESAEKEYQRQYSLGNWTKGVKESFKVGFLEGLEMQFQEQKQNNQEWGLVLVIPKEVKESYEIIQKGFREMSNSHQQNFNIDSNINIEAYINGHKNGFDFKPTQRIE